MVLIFGGTSEGRELAEICSKNNIAATVCVATEYGEEMLGMLSGVHILEGRRDEREISVLLRELQPELVLDATHPYAQVISQNVRSACAGENIGYVRIKRGESAYSANDSVLTFADIASAVDFLQNTEGNIFLTTGSKQLGEFAKLGVKRLYPRVLPDADSIAACSRIGIEKRQIVAMQGPFSAEMNALMLKEYGCAYLVTKESGRAGGFFEKLEACKRENATAIVIGRPKEEGISPEEAGILLLKMKKEQISCSVSILGIGMGSEEMLTVGALQRILDADALIGGERMVRFAGELRKRQGREIEAKELCSYKTEEIVVFLENTDLKCPVVLMSGDTGFFSGTKRLIGFLKERGIEASIFPGISSLSYLSAKIGIPWEDVKIISLHGRDAELESIVENHAKVFAITSGGEENRKVMERLDSAGYSELLVYVGENLSYSDEHIFCARVKDLTNFAFKKLSVLWIIKSENQNRENLQKDSSALHSGSAKELEIGLCDDRFLRGNIPMTKAEIRAVSMSKLGICEDSICWDLGAGTGSVSIEMAKFATEGRVYAVEKNPEAVELIAKNALQFGISHAVVKAESKEVAKIQRAKERLAIIQGDILSVIYKLPKPDCVFIGGSSGELSKIIELIFICNSKVKIVMNAVSLETIGKITEFLQSCGEAYMADISWISVTKTKKAGRYHLLDAQNPILVVGLKRRI